MADRWPKVGLVKPGLLIKMLRQLEADGITFELQPNGQFLVKPQPQPGTPVFKFCAKNAEQIRLELWLRTWCPPDDPTRLDHLAFTAKVKAVFGVSIFEAADVPYERSYHDMKREFLALMHGQDPDTHLLVLSRTIAVLGAAGLLQEQAWAFRCFIELGEEFALQDLEQKVAA